MAYIDKKKNKLVLKRNGKKYYGDLTLGEEKALEQAMEKYLEDKISGKLYPSKAEGDNGTFGYVVNKYWEMHQTEVSSATVRFWETAILPKLFGYQNGKWTSRLIKSIKTDEIFIFLKQYDDRPNLKRKLNSALSLLFRYAYEQGLIDINPIRSLPKMKVPKAKDESMRQLTDAEEVILANCRWNQRQEILIRLLMNYGLRRNEALALKKEDIDLANGSISIKRAFDFPINAPVEKEPKSSAGYRTLPLNDDDKKYLAKVIPKIKGDWLMTNADGSSPITLQAYRRLWESIKKEMSMTAKRLELQIPIVTDRDGKPKIVNGKIQRRKFTPRTLRHRYALMLAYQGVNARVIQYLLGHSDPVTTMKHYQTMESSPSEMKFEEIRKQIYPEEKEKGS